MKKHLTLGAIALATLCTFTACKKSGKNDNPNANFKGILADESLSSFDVAAPLVFTSEDVVWYHTADKSYGEPAAVDFRMNNDNTIDVFWRERANYKFHLTRISLATKQIVKDIPLPSELDANSSADATVFMGFDKIAPDKFVIGYTRRNQYDIKQPYYIAFNETGQKLWLTKLWEENTSASTPGTKSTPSGFGTAQVHYNATDKLIALYYDREFIFSGGAKHQSSVFSFIDPATGEQIYKKDANGNILTYPSTSYGATAGQKQLVGDLWYFSHNWDQRIISNSNGQYYTLAQGDSFPRALGLERWSKTGREANSQLLFENKLEGSGNETTSNIGDLIEFEPGKIAIVYATKTGGRQQKDLKICIVKNANTKPEIVKTTWITNYTTDFTGFGARIAKYGANRLLVAWNRFPVTRDAGSTGRTKAYATGYQLIDFDGNTASNLEEKEEKDYNALYPSQSMRPTPDGKNLIFVSAVAGKLRVNVLRVN